MNDGTWIVGFREVRFEEGRRPTVAYRNGNVIEFDLSDKNIQVEIMMLTMTSILIMKTP